MFVYYSTSNDETEHWRTLYEQLYSKVKPFQVSLCYDITFVTERFHDF